MFKKLLASTFITALVTSTALAYFSPEGCEHPFIDIVDHWGEEYICNLYETGNVQGYSERSFLPDDEITRAEFLKIALLNLGYDVLPMQGYEFTDSNPGDWHYKYGTFARFKGFMNGYSDGSWQPDALINRAEAVQLLVDIAGIMDFPTEYQDLLAFWDVSERDWFSDAVHVSLEYDIIEGKPDGGFHPYDDLTRAEASKIVDRAWEVLYVEYPVGLQK